MKYQNLILAQGQVNGHNIFAQGKFVKAGFESCQIFNLHFFASGIFGYLLNGKTTCIFDNSCHEQKFRNKLLFNSKLILSGLRLQLY